MTPIDPKQIRLELAKGDAFAGGEIINAIANLAETSERSVEDVIASLTVGTFMLTKELADDGAFSIFLTEGVRAAARLRAKAIRAAVLGDD